MLLKSWKKVLFLYYPGNVLTRSLSLIFYIIVLNKLEADVLQQKKDSTMSSKLCFFP